MKALTSFASKTLVLPYDTLAPGAEIEITIDAQDDTGLSSSKKKTYIIPNNISKVYCGPCQLNDRKKCAYFNGRCWKNYKSISEIPLSSSSNCLIYMASTCNEIWKANGFGDSQCKEYLKELDYIAMNTKPNAIYSKYVSGISRNIVIGFDIDINTVNIHNCQSVFAGDILEKLGQSTLFLINKKFF